MMKKLLLSILVVLIILGAAAWFNRIELILTAAKFKTSQKYAKIGPAREIPWQHGPSEPIANAAEQPPISF